MLRGLPACGKTTYAKELLGQYPGAYKRVNKDDLRAMLDAGHWGPKNEKFILEVRDLMIESALRAGHSVIVDDTNFAPKHEQRLREIATAHGADLETKDFEVSLEECIERDLKRQSSVGEKVIRKMYNQFLAEKIEPYPYSPELPSALISDIDGTIAIIGDRSPYDASRCEDDGFNKVVYTTVAGYKMDNGVQPLLILMSGREDKDRIPTERWLEKNNVDYLELHMRKTGDHRKDSIVKREIFDEHIRGKYNVIAVFDDRDQVVTMWRSLGLQVFQVADGDF